MACRWAAVTYPTYWFTPVAADFCAPLSQRCGAVTRVSAPEKVDSDDKFASKSAM